MQNQEQTLTKRFENSPQQVGKKLPSGIFGFFKAKGAADNLRMNALSDGVFAIVITLEVFSIKIPAVSISQAATELPRALISMLPDFMSLFLSFFILGIYWVGHNNVFQHVLRHDRLMLWLNILFLLTVALIPFPATLLVRYGDVQLSSILYSLNLAVGGILLDLIWAYATYNRHLMCDTVDRDLIRSFHVRILAGPVVYLLAIPISFVSLLAAKILFAGAIIYYLVPTGQDLLHHKQLVKTSFQEK